MFRASLCRVALVVGSLAATSAAPGAITYQSQNRFITASAISEGVTDSHSVFASGFGPFHANVSALAIGPVFMNTGNGFANQDSTLDPLEIVAGGSWSGYRSGQAGTPAGGGTTSFSVTFTLDEPADFTFDASGALTVFGFYYTGGGPGDGLYITQPGSYAGTLQAGPYSLTGEASGMAGFPPSGSGFSLHLVIPAPPALGALALMAFAAAGAVRRRR